jgi:DNA-binding Lrp family transcriptional regulator
VLTERLRRLEAEGVLLRTAYQNNPVRYDHRLTPKGNAVWDVLAALWRYGSDWLFADEGGPPGELYDTETGEAVEPEVVDRRTGEPIRIAATRIRARLT